MSRQIEKELRAWAVRESGTPDWIDFCSFIVDQSREVGSTGYESTGARLKASGLSEDAVGYVLLRFFGGDAP